MTSSVEVLVVFMLGNSRKLGLSDSVLRLREDMCEYWPKLIYGSTELIYERDDRKRVIETNSDLHSILLLVRHSREDYLLVSVISKNLSLCKRSERNSLDVSLSSVASSLIEGGSCDSFMIVSSI